MKIVAKRTAGMILILIGLFALVTPLTPGGFLFFIGLELVGIRLFFVDRLKNYFKRESKQ